MPYITKKTIDEATAVVELLNAMLKKIRVQYRDEFIGKIEENPTLSRLTKIVNAELEVSVRHAHTAKMCDRCDCLAVRMEDHQMTFKCMKAFKAKKFAVYDEKPQNEEIVNSVNIINKCSLKIKSKNANTYVKNIKKLTPQHKQKINARVEKVMKKKMQGIALVKETPYQIACKQKQYRIDNNIPVKKRGKTPVAEVETTAVVVVDEILPPIVEWKDVKLAEKKPIKKKKLIIVS